MDKTLITPWHEAYKEIANELYKHYKEYYADPGINLFDKLSRSTDFIKSNKWFENVVNGSFQSVDPIQLFASFSGNQLSSVKRLNRVNALLQVLNYDAEKYDEIDFSGCPSPVTINLLRVRDFTQQQQIWETFQSIIEKKKEGLNRYQFDSSKNWYGIHTNSFTIFLFWVDTAFIPLDKWTLNYLIGTNQIKSNKVSFDDYMKLINDSSLGDIKILVQNAYKSFADIQSQKTDDNQETSIPLNEFKIIGLRTLEKSNKYHKVLKPRELYTFDDQYELLDSEEYFLDRNADRVKRKDDALSLYNQGDQLKINISAVVGKNGSGKSTLMDLIFMGIYNLSIAKDYISKDEDGEQLKPLENLNFELYFVNQSLYKIVFTDKVEVFKFARNDNEFYIINEPASQDISHLFYGIAINYSHYALNSKDYQPDWITPLSHKNDGYVTPLVINPQRTEGNIDINKEKHLLNSRLLLNLLELHDSEVMANSFRYIENDKYFQSFKVSLDGDKINRKDSWSKKLNVSSDNKTVIWEAIAEIFYINSSQEMYDYETILRDYAVDKLIGICHKYRKYSERHLNNLFLALQGDGDLDTSAMTIAAQFKTDNSHVTEKFKQAINFIKYRELLEAVLLDGTQESISLDSYYDITQKIINNNLDEELEIKHLIPPSIFRLNFYLNNELDFNDSSSGEFQIISVISSILYHIRNIDSIEEDVFSQRFNFVNIFFDEVELYFHPDLQRTFIQRMHNSVIKLGRKLELVIGLNFIFLTHSPFILSDIPESKVLKMEKGIQRKSQNYNSFGANIHDLLADEFFMEKEGSIGAFAKAKIKRAIELMSGSRITEVQDRVFIRELIDIIGEPIIKHTLTQMYDKTFNKELEIEFYERKIQTLKKQMP